MVFDRVRQRTNRLVVAGTILASLAGAAPSLNGRAEASVRSSLPEVCEVGLALSAAPEHLRAGAGVFVWTGHGYSQRRSSRNGFTCIVNRDDEFSIKPTCFDEEGTRTMVPRILFVARQLARGESAASVADEVAKGFEAGRFERPNRPGVAFMLSHYNRPWDPEARTLGLFPPHVMFFAPDLSNADIGASPQLTWNSEPHLPFIAYEGPHGFMVVRTELEAKPSAYPLEGCPSWLTTGQILEEQTK